MYTYVKTVGKQKLNNNKPLHVDQRKITFVNAHAIFARVYKHIIII